MSPLDTHKLAKLVARAGYASRREAERLILAGQVSVDGVCCDNPAMRFPAEVQITVAGREALCVEKTRVFVYYKPRGLVTSHRDEMGRPTVFEALPSSLPRVVSVGRLDMDSEGLLLLTNDGTLAGKLEKSALERCYRVRVWGCPTREQIASLAKGIIIDGLIYAPIKVTLDQVGNNSWLSVTLTEGKNREIRHAMAYFGLRVNRLIRYQFGAVALGNLSAGQWRELKAEEITSLIDMREACWR